MIFWMGVFERLLNSCVDDSLCFFVDGLFYMINYLFSKLKKKEGWDMFGFTSSYSWVANLLLRIVF